MDSDQIRIAIVSPEKSAYSATFIKAHLDLIDADITHLYGVFFPVSSADNHYVLQENTFIRKAFSKLKLERTYKRFFRNPQLVRYFRQEKFQLIFAEFGMVGAEVVDICEELGIPLIVHFHGNDAYLYHVWEKYKKQYKVMFHYAKHIIVVSKYMHQRLKDTGVPDSKLVLNSYGPNDAFFSVSPTFEEINFIAVGRFVNKKAPHLTIKAFKKVHDHIPHATLKMAGDGPLLDICKQLAAELNITEAIEFLGATSHEQIVELYRNVYCFVQHSVVAPDGDSEGTPVAILEACAAGLPVVATKHAGIQDVILHGKTGFLVNEHDVAGMADYMIQLAQDRKLVKNMGQKGRNRIKENFTMDRHIAVIDDLIKKAVQ